MLYFTEKSVTPFLTSIPRRLVICSTLLFLMDIRNLSKLWEIANYMFVLKINWKFKLNQGTVGKTEIIFQYDRLTNSCFVIICINSMCSWGDVTSVSLEILFLFRLGEITLGDFKEAIDRPGMFRYHFKALDPEFGTVKEEVCKGLLILWSKGGITDQSLWYICSMKLARRGLVSKKTVVLCRRGITS